MASTTTRNLVCYFTLCLRGENTSLWFHRITSRWSSRNHRTAMRSHQLWQLQLWQRWIIGTFWLGQMTILIVPITELLVTLMAQARLPEISQDWRNRHSNFELFSLVVSVALQITEFCLYRLADLTPLIYLGSQIFKSVAPSLELYRFVQAYRHLKYHRNVQLGWGVIVEEIVRTLTFWGALVYAIYVIILSLRRRRRYLSMTIAEQIEDLFPTKGINTAANLRTTSPILFKLVRWLNSNDPWTKNLPESLKTPTKWILFVAKYALSVIPIAILFSVSPRLPGEPVKSGTPQPPDDWKYPAHYNLNPYSDSEAMNTLDSAADFDEESVIDTVGLYSLNSSRRSTRLSRHSTGLSRRVPAEEQESTERNLLPWFLCFINETNDQSSESTYSTRKVSDVVNRSVGIDYIFISYTRRQFYSQISNDPSLSANERVHFKAAAERDKAELIRFAVAAAKEAGVSAFWIDFECIQPEEESPEGSDIEEVYRICDIVRASHSMAIVLGPALDETKEHVMDTSKEDWLLDWGERLWTVPEALLCPSEHRIAIYGVGSDVPEKVAKRNLPARVWDDAGKLRQLMDHYEGSLHLTQLELMCIALECLQRRQTEKRNAGDVAYALMGLLRLRPKVNKMDTDFQAFARLSLANDSNMLLERLICLSKQTKNSPWYDMTDTWNARLWQISPRIQVAGLESNNAIVIGNASGALIDWSSLHPVDFKPAGERKLLWKITRNITRYLLAWLVVYYVFQFIFVPVMGAFDLRYRKNMQARVDQMLKMYGVGWLILSLFTLPIPAILSRHFRSKLGTIQARFFGIEGRPKLEEVEAYIFGGHCGRLRWGADSAFDETFTQSHEDPRRLFTLIDTLSSTATTFRADEPPSLAFIGASDQGLLRALLCSYDFTYRTFVKESVVRLESTALQRMEPLDRFRFSISPTSERSAQATASHSLESDRISIPDIPEFRSLDD